MYEIQNVEVIINIFIRSSRDPWKKQTAPRFVTTALNPKLFENVAYIKSIHIKGVISSSYAKANGVSRTNEHSHSRHRHLALNYVHVITRTQRYMWEKVDTVRMAK